MKILKLKTGESTPPNYTGKILDTSNRQFWFVNGEYHRENGPAYIDSSENYQQWWFEGRFLGSSQSYTHLSEGVVLDKTDDIYSILTEHGTNTYMDTHWTNCRVPLDHPYFKDLKRLYRE